MSFCYVNLGYNFKKIQYSWAFNEITANLYPPIGRTVEQFENNYSVITVSNSGKFKTIIEEYTLKILQEAIETAKKKKNKHESLLLKEKLSKVYIKLFCVMTNLVVIMVKTLCLRRYPLNLFDVN